MEFLVVISKQFLQNIPLNAAAGGNLSAPTHTKKPSSNTNQIELNSMQHAFFSHSVIRTPITIKLNSTETIKKKPEKLSERKVCLCWDKNGEKVRM